MRFWSLSLLFCLLLTLPAGAQTPPPPASRDLSADTWAATDALGRTLPTAANAPSKRAGRYVGVFYFLWHGEHGTDGPYDNSQIIADPAHNAFGGPGAFHWWGEPAVGYFLGTDPWVHRKNLQMLADAGVDVLFFDVTNAFTYPREVETICRVATEMRREGNATPQIAFLTHAGGSRTVTTLYNDFYAKNSYPDLWFRWEGKPLILGDVDNTENGVTLPDTIKNFFTWRHSWAWDPGQDKWQWIDKYPQRAGWHTSQDVPEEVPVSVAGHPTDSLGRSYHSDEQWGHGTEPAVDSHYLAADVDQGIQFSQQWQQALKIDPQFILVTGWNEWVAQRFLADGPRPFAGHTLAKGGTFFVDNYNEEFSRDVMPMKGGYGDDYYMQLVDGIRRYKGVRLSPLASARQTIRLSGPFDQWQAVRPEYRDALGDTGHRDWAGWGGRHYTDATGRNDIARAKVACDAASVYFYVQTRDKTTPSSDPNWMQLLIDADHNPKTGWNGYDFVVNSRVLGPKTTTLKRLSDGKIWPVPYRLAGNQMMIALPRALLGLTDAHKTTFDFHWADNVPIGGDLARIADWWYQGDSAPDGRFNSHYASTH